ncbi:MAG: helix-turn-helix domain-containing protein [Sphingorhabdus sp.]
MAPNETRQYLAGEAAGDDRLLAAADVVRAAIQHNRSDKLLRLFEYLLAKTFEGKIPTEMQIASDVFAKDKLIDGAPDANVRVHIHRLRKLMKDVFTGTSGPRITIPVAEYRIHLLNDTPIADEPRPPGGRNKLWGSIARSPIILLMSIAIAVVLFAALLTFWPRRESDSIAGSPVWQTFEASDRPITVVVGDYYMFADQAGTGADRFKGPRLIWDSSVPTREDLTIFQMLNPSAAHTVIDFDQHYVTSGTIAALGDIRAALAQIPQLRNIPIKLMTSSQLTPEILKSSDIIYVGLFNGMSMLLLDPLLNASGFRFDKDHGGLTDSASATRYRSDGMVLTDERIARRDFGYIANVPGPAGNRIIVVAGTGDAGLKEVAALVGDPNRLRRLQSNEAKRELGFETLYRVRTIKSVNVGATLLIDRPLQSKGIWDQSGKAPAYRPLDTTLPSNQID